MLRALSWAAKRYCFDIKAAAALQEMGRGQHRTAQCSLGCQVVLLAHQRCCGPCREQANMTAEMHYWDNEESVLLVVLAGHGRSRGGAGWRDNA